MIRALVLLCFLVPATGAHALTFTFPGPARETSVSEENLTRYALPTGRWAAGRIPSKEVEGALTARSWRINNTTLSTTQIIQPLRDQLISEGYEIVFECNTWDCGGFDFRFSTRVINAPDMIVSLGDFRFLSAQKTDGDVPEYLSLLVSRTADAGYAQMIRVGRREARAPKILAATKSTPVVGAEFLSGALVAELDARGAAVLDDLAFEVGSSSLSEGEYGSLTELAEYLRANPARRIILVGHTDNEGSLEGNEALSRKRAASVATELTRRYDIPAARIEAKGVGYLAPRVSNDSAEGRTLNRRVEAILVELPD